jgi:hypothetical protein
MAMDVEGDTRKQGSVEEKQFRGIANHSLGPGRARRGFPNIIWATRTAAPREWPSQA